LELRVPYQLSNYHDIPESESAMQAVVQVVCQGSASLRALISRQEDKLQQHNLKLISEKRQNRNPGWMNIKSSEGDLGSINASWNQDTRSLICRVVNRGQGTPSGIIGQFVAFLLAYHRARIKQISRFEV
jgi:hypothetical protein